MEDLSKYQGVIVAPLEDTDFIAGTTSPLKLELRNQTYDWLQFFSAGERQSFPWGDSQGCVSFTAVHHLVATQLNWMLTNKLLPQVTEQFFRDNGYIVQEKFNLSERFIVSLSGTTLQGNSAQNVLQAIRKCGIVPESICPNDGPANRDQYMTISEEARALGLESLKYLTFFWQAVPKNLIPKYLVQAPVMEFTAVCPGWGSDVVIQKCDQPIQHATAIYAVNFLSKHYMIFDQYQSSSNGTFTKQLAADYEIPYAFQLIVYPIPQGTAVERHIFDKSINQSSKIPGETSSEVQFLQVRLGIPPTGTYDQATADAVLNFQLEELPKRGLASIWELLWLHGRAVGPKTRKVLNEI